jgi:transposase
VSTTAASFAGIDVSKDHLDLHLRPSGAAARFANDPTGLTALVARLAAAPPTLTVLEATGGYQSPAVAALAAAGLAVAVVNPRQARQFAASLGRRAKTDAIDAAALAHFAEAVRPQPRPLPDADAAALRALLDRRGQLLGMRVAEQQRLPTAPGAVARGIRDHVKWLDRRLKAVEADLDKAVRSSPVWRARDDLLRSVPGVGPQVSRTLLAELPELGTAGGRELSSLAGLAPFSRDSGRKVGRRCIAGGRAAVRKALYQAAVVAMRYNKPMADFYHRLVGRGKAKKVALVAVARRLLTILNAILRSRQPWDEKRALPA